jgi:hypothetical protein
MPLRKTAEKSHHSDYAGRTLALGRRWYVFQEKTARSWEIRQIIRRREWESYKREMSPRETGRQVGLARL